MVIKSLEQERENQVFTPLFKKSEVIVEALQKPLSVKETPFSPEQRLYDDVTTWLAEAIDGRMRTKFEYSFDGHELYGRDGGALRPVFDDAIEQARHFGPDMSFELRRRLIEKDEYNLMLQMARGDAPNTMVVVSDFPPELMGYSTDFGGYNVRRKITMLRVVTKGVDGKITMRSQSLDQSDRVALEAMYDHLGLRPQAGELLGQRAHLDLDAADQEFLEDGLMGAYDRSLAARYGGTYYAGRREEDHANTYDFVIRQTDLLNEFINDSYIGIDKGVLYGLAAAMQNRYTNRHKQNAQTHHTGEGGYYARQEILNEGNKAAARGEVYSACGDTLTNGVGAVPSSASAEMRAAGYGNKIETDRFGPLVFKCKKGHVNKRPRDKLIPKCKKCGTDVSCGPKQQKQPSRKRKESYHKKQGLGAFLTKAETK